MGDASGASENLNPQQPIELVSSQIIASSTSPFIMDHHDSGSNSGWELTSLDKASFECNIEAVTDNQVVLENKTLEETNMESVEENSCEKSNVHVLDEKDNSEREPESFKPPHTASSDLIDAEVISQTSLSQIDDLTEKKQEFISEEDISNMEPSIPEVNDKQGLNVESPSSNSLIEHPPDELIKNQQGDTQNDEGYKDSSAANPSTLSQSSIEAHMEKVIENIVELGGCETLPQVIDSCGEVMDKQAAVEAIQKEIIGTPTKPSNETDLVVFETTQQETTELVAGDVHVGEDLKKFSDTASSTSVTRATPEKEASPTPIEPEPQAIISDTKEPTDCMLVETLPEVHDDQPKEELKPKTSPEHHEAHVQDQSQDPERKVSPESEAKQESGSELRTRAHLSRRAKLAKPEKDIPQTEKAETRRHDMREDLNSSIGSHISTESESRREPQKREPKPKIFKRAASSQPKIQLKRPARKISDHIEAEESKVKAVPAKKSAGNIPSSRSTIASSMPSSISDHRKLTTDIDYGLDKKYRCEKCRYATDRLNNIVYHKKSTCEYTQKQYNDQVALWKLRMQSPKSNSKKTSK